MIKWGDYRRDHDAILAVWPAYKPRLDRWFMMELVGTEIGGVRWRERRVPDENNNVRMDVYDIRETAVAAAEKLNPALAEALAARSMAAAEKTSLTLKVRKATQARQRLMDEEALMLAEAVKRHQTDSRTPAGQLQLHPESEPYRAALAAELDAYPYLRIAMVAGPGGQRILFRDPKDAWSKAYYPTDKAAEAARRARVANGFGFHHEQHWGQVKAKIRAELEPRAN